jgi:hypothetical protein
MARARDCARARAAGDIPARSSLYFLAIVKFPRWTIAVEEYSFKRISGGASPAQINARRAHRMTDQIGAPRRRALEDPFVGIVP